jgi:hypothetical protein
MKVVICWRNCTLNQKVDSCVDHPTQTFPAVPWLPFLVDSSPTVKCAGMRASVRSASPARSGSTTTTRTWKVGRPSAKCLAGSAISCATTCAPSHLRSSASCRERARPTPRRPIPRSPSGDLRPSGPEKLLGVRVASRWSVPPPRRASVLPPHLQLEVGHIFFT